MILKITKINDGDDNDAKNNMKTKSNLYSTIIFCLGIDDNKALDFQNEFGRSQTMFITSSTTFSLLTEK